MASVPAPLPAAPGASLLGEHLLPSPFPWGATFHVFQPMPRQPLCLLENVKNGTPVQRDLLCGAARQLSHPLVKRPIRHNTGQLRWPWWNGVQSKGPSGAPEGPGAEEAGRRLRWTGRAVLAVMQKSSPTTAWVRA